MGTVLSLKGAEIQGKDEAALCAWRCEWSGFHSGAHVGVEYGGQSSGTGGQ